MGGFVKVGRGVGVSDAAEGGLGVSVDLTVSVACCPTTAPNVTVGPVGVIDGVTGEVRLACLTAVAVATAFAVADEMIETAVSSMPGTCVGGGCVGVTSTTIGVAGAQAAASVRSRARPRSFE